MNLYVTDSRPFSKEIFFVLAWFAADGVFSDIKAGERNEEQRRAGEEEDFSQHGFGRVLFQNVLSCICLVVLVNILKLVWRGEKKI